MKNTSEDSRTKKRAMNFRGDVSPVRLRPRQFYGAMATAAVMVLLAAPAQAQFASWVGSTGDWGENANWSVFTGPPDASKEARINNGGTAVYTEEGSSEIESLSLGTLAGQSGTLTIVAGSVGNRLHYSRTGVIGNAGTGTLNLFSSFGVSDSESTTLGHQASGVGIASLQGDYIWYPGEILQIGLSGMGTVGVSGGGKLYPDRVTSVGVNAGSRGLLIVDGPGSVFDMLQINNFSDSGQLYLGGLGMGTLTVTNGATFKVRSASFGQGAGASGRALVAGAGSTWSSESLFLGIDGVGEFTADSGGIATIVGPVTIGAQGLLSTSGNNSSVVISGAFNSSGVLEVTSGGNQLTQQAAMLASGTASVVGLGSEWIVGGSLSIGAGGTSSLTVSGGGYVGSGDSIVGSAAGSVGSVAVSGLLSRWTTAQLTVGDGGQGTITISGGGIVASSGESIIGVQMNSAGSVTVSGPTSQFYCAHNLGIKVGVDGSGTLTLTDGGVATAVGGLTVGPLGVVQGVGTVSGNLFNRGVVAPGNSPGTLQVVGDYTQNAAGNLILEIESASAFDKLIVAGHVNLGGSLALSLTNDFAPAAGQAFDLFDWASVAGSFDTLSLPPLDAGLSWDTSQLYSTGVLSVTSAGISGDFDLDGDVDGRDFLAWQRGESATPFSAGDLADWQAAYKGGLLSALRLPPSALHAAVPEPDCWLLLAMAAIPWIAGRR